MKFFQFQQDGILIDIYYSNNKLAPVYKWENYYKPLLKKIDRGKLIQYTGKYTSHDREYIISQDKGNLFLELMGQKWQVYFTFDTDFFMYQAPEINHQFIYRNNKIQGFQINLDGGKNIFVKKAV